jgi:hypothetical protein
MKHQIIPIFFVEILVNEYFNDITESLCLRRKIIKSTKTGSWCGSKHNKRYNSTGLLAGNIWFIYRYCREWIEYAGLV